MKINTQSLKFDADSKLLEYIEKKLGRLDKFYGVVAADVTLTLEHGNEHHSAKCAKIRLEVAGGDIFAEHTDTTFEAAIDHCVDAIKKQLVKHKEKMQGE
jgi:putative sigma-54 modulation protein